MTRAAPDEAEMVVVDGELLGFGVVFDDALPPDVIEIRDRKTGELLGRVTGVDVDALAARLREGG